MKVTKFSKENIIKVSDTITRTIVHGKDIMSVVVDFTGGPNSEPDPYHSHPHEQTCYVAKGEVLFFAEGDETVHLVEGDMVAVAPNQPHTIQLLTPEARLIDSFNPIREDFIK